MTVDLGDEHIPLLKKLQETLETEPNGIKQQVAIELLTAWHAMRAGNGRAALIIADGVNKHVKQIIHGASEIPAVVRIAGGL